MDLVGNRWTYSFKNLEGTEISGIASSITEQVTEHGSAMFQVEAITRDVKPNTGEEKEMESVPIQPDLSNLENGEIPVKVLKNGKWVTVQTLTPEEFEIYLDKETEDKDRSW